MTLEKDTKKENKTKKKASESKVLKPLNNLGDIFKKNNALKSLLEKAEKYRARKSAPKQARTQDTLNREKTND